MDRRVHVAEVPLVSRDLSVRVAVERAKHQQELILGKIEVDDREREGMERQVPRGVPRVFPLVGHGDHVSIEHVEPLGVPRVPPRGADERMRLVLLEPRVQIEQVVLLRPEHPGERLPVDAPFVLGQRARRDPVVELVGVGQPRREGRVEVRPERLVPTVGGHGQPQTNGQRAASWHVEDVSGRSLRPGLRRVHRFGVAGDDVLVERVLDPWRGVRLTPEAVGVALVFGEEELGRPVAGKRVFAQLVM